MRRGEGEVGFSFLCFPRPLVFPVFTRVLIVLSLSFSTRRRAPRARPARPRAPQQRRRPSPSSSSANYLLSSSLPLSLWNESPPRKRPRRSAPQFQPWPARRMCRCCTSGQGRGSAPSKRKKKKRPFRRCRRRRFRLSQPQQQRLRPCSLEGKPLRPPRLRAPSR